MGPLRLNRRHFLGSSVAAGLAFAQGVPVESGEPPRLVRLGLIGAGNRGTTLLRTALELPGVQVAAVADLEPKHRLRAQGIVEKASQSRPDAHEDPAALLARDDLDAVLIALPCDEHARAYVAAIRAGKHLYAEKPLAPTLAECDAVLDEAERHPEVVVHVGYQRRSNPRYREAVELVQRGGLGPLLTIQGQWVSSNGPVLGHRGWLGLRARSGDWMVEQAVHIWDVLHWLAGGPPTEAVGWGTRGLFTDRQPDRDVTDQYTVQLGWPNGLTAQFLHSWAAPADDAFTGTRLQVLGGSGGIDLTTGVASFRDPSQPKRTIAPGAAPDTKLALAAFLDAVRAPEPPAPPLSLREAREATRIGLLVRGAVDAQPRRLVRLDEIDPPGGGKPPPTG